MCRPRSRSILRRDVHAAPDSPVRAEASGVWNGGVQTANVSFGEDVRKDFVESRGRYDVGVGKLLNENGVEFDVFDYDKAKNVETLVVRNNGCVIWNCNFRKMPAVVDAAAGGGATDAPV